MAFLGPMLSPGSGSGFNANGAPILTPVGPAQTGSVESAAASAAQQQQALATQVNGNNALGNQGYAFNNLAGMQQGLNSLAGGAVNAQGNALANLQGTNIGFQNQNAINNGASVFLQQQNLANQLQGVANGTGPNPALAQLQQQTEQNITNQAALMASQRGASANPGLIARQAAQQGAATQQQAVGQAATLQAQQQLNAMNALSGQQANMGNLALGQTQQMQNEQNAIANLSGQQIGQQQANAQALANLSQAQVQNQLQATGQLNQAAQAEQSAILNAAAQQNNAQIGMQSNINNANSSIAGINSQGQWGLLGGLGQGLGSAVSNVPVIGNLLGSLAYGGEVKKYAAGDIVSSVVAPTGGPDIGSVHIPTMANPFAQKGKKKGEPITRTTQAQPWDFGGGLGGSPTDTMDNTQGLSSPGADLGPESQVGQMLGAKGGLVRRKRFDEGGDVESEITSQTGAPTGGPDIGSPSIPTLQNPFASSGGKGGGGAGGIAGLMALAASQGGAIKGEAYANQMKPVPGKAAVKGDSYQNDTVRALLSPGEIILPRHITQSKDAPEKARAFVAAIMAKKGLRRAK